MTLTFQARGIPKGQPRPKAFVRGTRAGVYDPGTAEEWKRIVREECAKAWNRVQFTGPVSVTFGFDMPRPKAHFRSNGDLKPTAPHWSTSKPDVDNLAKAVLDALTNLGVWRDDSQVVKLWVGRVYGIAPGCVVSVDDAT